MLFVPKDRKSLFRQFLSGMYDAVIITDPNGHILEVNSRATEHFGYEADEVLDKHVSLFLPGLSAEIVQRVRKGLEDDRHILIDANGQTKDGRKIACEVTVSAIDLMDPGDLVFTVRNVERRHALMTMLRTKANACEIAPCALFGCDADGTFQFCNDAFRTMFGFDNSEAAAKHTFGEILPDDPLPENFRKALAGETTTVEIVAECEDGEPSAAMEITLAPNALGRKTFGVVGSIMKAR